MLVWDILLDLDGLSPSTSRYYCDYKKGRTRELKQCFLLVGSFENCISGKMTPGHASLGKSWTTLRAREAVALGRELLGGNGILAHFHVTGILQFGSHLYITYDINTSVIGRKVTCFASFKAPLRQKSHL